VPLKVKRISKSVVSSVSSFFNAKPCAAMLRAQSVRQQNNVYDSYYCAGSQTLITLCHYSMPPHATPYSKV
jgi:hypothetical protein